MKILDLTAGKRAIWFNKNYPECLFLDIRAEVGPDIIGDARDLSPLIGKDYDLIVFES